MSESIRDVIAVRTLRDDASIERNITVQIGMPHEVSITEWKCAFYITNIGMHEVQFGHGVDGIQALIQAIEGVRVTLERSGQILTWEGGEEGDIGIPRYVPMSYGKGFAKRLHQLIDRELERHALSAEKRYREESRHKTPKKGSDDVE